MEEMDALKKRRKAMRDLNEKYQALLVVKEGITEESIDKEWQECDKYEEEKFDIQQKVSVLRNPDKEETIPIASEDTVINVKLPELALKNYEGSLEGANYALAVQALQERFGDSNILTELYVRRLLNSVITNVKKENRNLSSLYDELSSHLRSLETLGIDPQLSGIFLYPLVESSLPSDILKIWHRHPSSGYGLELAKREESDKGVGGAQERLRLLLDFLKAERIFDPLGFCAPVFLPPKLLLQRSWGLKLGWDTPLPESMAQEFRTWLAQIKLIELIKIPRYMWNDLIFPTEVHIFCDASQIGYGAVAYLRSETGRENTLTLIWSKVRLAPMKSITIPRLELMAMVLGARLANAIQAALKRKCETTLWSDSTTALSWINKEIEWRVFVRNRVREIQATTNLNDWRFVPSQLNPADLLSRGCPPSQFVQSRWWEGPEWLKKPKEFWPNSEFSINPKEINVEENIMKTRELKQRFLKEYLGALIQKSENIDRRQLKVGDVVLIGQENLKRMFWPKGRIVNLIPGKDGIVRVAHVKTSTGTLIRALQRLHPLEISSNVETIQRDNSNTEPQSEAFLGNRPNIESRDSRNRYGRVIRKHARWNHETHGHAGLQTLLGILRENYWILRSRKTVKKIINQCIRCKRFTATPATVESTSLPEDRNKKKAWIVIFTCAVYRGVHLELVTSLSMEAFLQAFRRFIARRGRPLIVYSDNGTNFKGMANALKKIDFSRLKCDPTLKNITWKFIPPGAPWWGGWWERLIGMMKQLLFRILGQTSLGYEELSTVMCDVESLMNTRPLTYLTEESEDLAPLTPSLFLHEVREVGVPDLDLIDNQTLSRKYQYIKRVREDLRERFRIEYFGFLRQETRRLKTTIPFKVGDMVLIGQESLKRLHWPLARIIQLYPGKDGLVRVAKMKTSSGDKIRPIQKLYNLEITPEIRCRDPLTERSPTQEVRLTTEEDPLTSQQEQNHIDTPNVVSSYGRPIKRPNRLDLLNFSFPCLSGRDANSKVGEMLEKTSEAANGRPAEAATGMQRLK
ncbi:hypothetical protein LAZ67_19002211 [Cordylochernes scorpioides]|uniref:Integrase catalytic domain-containing protein n=1 Tax=Cordylochernes scorpioides TaxID=51811 RepID=A0ABY6LKK0_9ARAC|nr:hypothetical protein LAZ67_19002211 [Cordylochernes scorpioides]